LQRRLVPMIGVLTPGSPGVAPYAETGARFEIEASQLEVLDDRPIQAILGEFLAAGATIDRFEAAGQPIRPSRHAHETDGGRSRHEPDRGGSGTRLPSPPLRHPGRLAAGTASLDPVPPGV